MTYPEDKFVIAITQENVAETLWAQMWACFRLPEIFVGQILGLIIHKEHKTMWEHLAKAVAVVVVEEVARAVVEKIREDWAVWCDFQAETFAKPLKFDF